MKIKLLLILTILLISSINTDAIGQSIRVSYREKIKFCKRIEDALPMEQLSKMDRLAKNSVSYYSLTICPKYSYWQFDSIRWNCSIGLPSNDRPIDYLQYDTSDIKIMKFDFDPKGQYYLATHDVPRWPMQWDIDFTRTKMILGYKCFWAKYKWENKMMIEVWFAPEIPTSFGPKDLNGLPGLVLEFTTISNQYIAENISSISPDLCPEIHIEEVKKINLEERNNLYMNHDYSIKAQDFDCGGKAKKTK